MCQPRLTRQRPQHPAIEIAVYTGVMMVATMVPTAVPMTLLYAAVARKAAAQHSPVAPAFIFVAGYAAMWAIFSLVATATR